MDWKYNILCTRCERFIKPHSIPHGIVWLCECGHWEAIFSIAGGVSQLRTGDEERALWYIAKIGQMLGVDKNV